MDDTHDDVQLAIEKLRVTEIDVPSLPRGHVLVRIEAAPFNPADLLMMRDSTGSRVRFPPRSGWKAQGASWMRVRACSAATSWGSV